MSVVALTAALCALAEPRVQQCEGKLECPECGSLSWHHNTIGDRAAITDLVLDMVGDLIKDTKEIEAALRRVYFKQRSAYVHGAQLRHDEDSQANGAVPSLPSRDAPLPESQIFSDDLATMQRITRAVLLRWLARASHRSLDDELMRLSETPLVASWKFLVTGTVRGSRVFMLT